MKPKGQVHQPESARRRNQVHSTVSAGSRIETKSEAEWSLEVPGKKLEVTRTT